ncbi:MAG: LamG-like jellyroll fold domain-containing protein [Spirochaetota bacterium]
MFRSVLSRTVIVCFAALALYPKLPMTNGLLVYAPFENTADPVFYRGQKNIDKQAIAFASGKFGFCARLNGTRISLPTAKNIHPPVGTTAFWILLDSAITDASANADIFFGTDHVRLNYYTSKKVLFYMTGTTIKEKGFQWSYSEYKGINNWKTGEWHHIAIAWDAAAGHKTMWVDGAVVIDQDTVLVNSNYTGNKFMTLGASNVPMRIDEWYVWDRVLSTEDIAAVMEGSAAGSIQRTVEKRSLPLTFRLHVYKDDPSALIVEPGERFSMRVMISNAGTEDHRASYEARLIDIRGEEKARVPFIVDGKARQATDVVIDLTVAEQGVFKALTTVLGEDRDLGTFTVLPKKLSSTGNSGSFFGNHVNAWSGPMIDLAARLGQSWMRGHNMLQSTWWIRVQPEQSTFTWSYDFQMSNVNRYNMPVLGQFFGVPYWASQMSAPKPVSKNDYPKGYVPQWKPFSEYVYETVKHFREIKYWEIGNEPEVSMFWSGTPEDFAEYCRVAYEAAKKADPSSVVMLGGSTTPPWMWHEQSAKAGAYKYCDVVSIHLSYGNPRIPLAQAEKEWRAIIDHFNEMCVKYGNGKPLPLWTTEGGTSDTPWLGNIDYEKAKAGDGLPDQISAYEGATAMVKGEMLIQAMGFEKHFVYIQNIASGPSVFEDVNMLEFTHAPRPKLAARVVLASLIDDLVPLGKYVHREDIGLWAFFWNKPGTGKSLAAVFCDKGWKLSSISGLPVVAVIDLMGNRVSDGVASIAEEPQYLKLTIPAEKAYEYFKTVSPSVLARGKITSASDSDGAGPVIPGYVAPTEGSSSKIFAIDIKPFCTMGFADEKNGDGVGGWSDEGPLNDMRDFPVGRQLFHNVPFTIIDPKENGGKSVITLKSRNITPNQPQSVSGIPVGQKVRNLYFLHAAAWGTMGVIGSYVVKYADGTSAPIPLTIPDTIHNWWNGYDAKERAKPVPIRVSNTATGKPAWRYVRVLEWENKKTDVQIASIDFISADGVQAPILIAVTGLSW